MTINYTRPETINRYAKQKAFIDAHARYTVVEASTKAGKTSAMIVWLFEQAISPHGSHYVINDKIVPHKGVKEKVGCIYWWIAPTYSQAKIAFRRMKRYITNKDIFKSNESELALLLFNGSVIAFKSGEISDNLYGEDVYAAVIDEATRMRQDSWYAIRSTLTATNGLCKIIGNVKGIGNWVYELARNAEAGTPNWSYHKLTAADAVEAGILSKEEIEDAERTLPKGIFLELYYAIPFVNSANKFAFAFDKSKHTGKAAINYKYPVYLSFDFNRNPICCGIYQYYDNVVYVCEIIKLINSNIYSLCAHLKNKLWMGGKDPFVIVNGDASGNAGSAMVKDNLNYFRIIKAELGLATSQMQQLGANPSIAENQVLVNAVLEHVPHVIDLDDAQPLIFDLDFAEMLPDGTLKKTDRNDPAQQLDALDTYRYFINRNLNHFLKGYR